MRDTKTVFAAMLLVSTLLGSVGQLLFKIGIDSTVLSALAAYLFAGIIAYGLATIIYLYILGRTHLSWAYGFVGFSYIFTVILAFFILKEPISAARWAGVIVIAVGTALIGTS